MIYLVANNFAVINPLSVPNSKAAAENTGTKYRIPL
jgi:hypothetical protein